MKKLSIAIAAMLLAAQLSGQVANAAGSEVDLVTIQSLINQNDAAGLRALIEANPQLLEGDSALAVHLRAFETAATGLIDALSRLVGVLSVSVPAAIAGVATAATSAVTNGAPGDDGHRLIFMPTNDVGLDHVKRTPPIAAEGDRTGVDLEFAASPTCIKMLQPYGFDVMPMISGSAFHAQEHKKDLVKAARLRAPRATR